MYALGYLIIGYKYPCVSETCFHALHRLLCVSIVVCTSYLACLKGYSIVIAFVCLKGYGIVITCLSTISFFRMLYFFIYQFMDREWLRFTPRSGTTF